MTASSVWFTADVPKLLVQVFYLKYKERRQLNGWSAYTNTTYRTCTLYQCQKVGADRACLKGRLYPAVFLCIIWQVDQFKAQQYVFTSLTHTEGEARTNTQLFKENAQSKAQAMPYLIMWISSFLLFGSQNQIITFDPLTQTDTRYWVQLQWDNFHPKTFIPDTMWGFYCFCFSDIVNEAPYYS